MPVPAILHPLRHRAFRRIFAGQLTSGLGDWIDFLGVVVLVSYVWGLGAGALAAVAVAAAIPWVVVAPLAGVWADRLPTRVVLVGCDLARAALVLAYLFAPNLPTLLFLLIAKVAVGTLFVPAEQAAVRHTVPAADLLAALSLTMITGQATKVLGPVIGGVLVATVGPHGAFVVDAATFLLSAAILWGLPNRVRSSGAAAPPASFGAELRAGLAHIVRNRIVAAAVLSMMTTMLLVFTFDALAPLVLRELGLPPSYLGFAMAGIGLGTVGGTLLIGQLGERVHPLVVLAASQVAAGTLVAGVGLTTIGRTELPPVVWLAIAIGIGLAAAGILVAFPYLLQRETPPAMIGRVVATATAIPTLMQLVAPPIGAVAADRHGVGPVFALAGVGLAIIGFALALWFGVRSGAPVPRLELRMGTEPDVVAHMDAVAPPPVDRIPPLAPGVVGLRGRGVVF